MNGDVAAADARVVRFMMGVVVKGCEEMVELVGT